MKKSIILLTCFCLLLTGCSKTVTEIPGEKTAEPSATAAADVVSSENPDATLSPDMPAQQTANPTPTPTPVPDESAHLSQMYIDIIKSNNYFMKAKVQGESGINEFAVSVNGSSTAMETASGSTLYNTVIKDGITYMIDHQNKIVITSGAEVSSSASNMAGETISTDGITFTKKGNGDFAGENLQFDEYQTPAGGTMRFYFRDNALAGIESVDGEETLIYTIEELSAGHRAAMHEIPASYQLLDMAALGG